MQWFQKVSYFHVKRDLNSLAAAMENIGAFHQEGACFSSKDGGIAQLIVISHEIKSMVEVAMLKVISIEGRVYSPTIFFRITRGGLYLPPCLIIGIIWNACRNINLTINPHCIFPLHISLVRFSRCASQGVKLRESGWHACKPAMLKVMDRESKDFVLPLFSLGLQI
jgi:hypothetical protein